MCFTGVWMPSGVHGDTNTILQASQPSTGLKSSGPVVDIAAMDQNRIMVMAAATLLLEPVTITRYHAALSPGSPNDFFSTGEFWWPNTNSPDGLPYYRRSGRPNPDVFAEHRKCLSVFRDNLTALAAAYKVTGNDRYATVGAEWLKVFFINPATRMNPNVQYAQSVPGIATGRTGGIQDVLPLVEVPVAVKTLEKSPSFSPEISAGFRKWAADYLDWLMTSAKSDDLADTGDNFTLIYWLNVAVFADYLGDQERLDICRNRFKYFLLSNQIGPDGNFTYAPRNRVFDAMLSQSDYLGTLCQVLSTSNDDLWHFTSPEGRNVRQMVDHLYGQLENKTKWSKRHGEGVPRRESNLLFAGIAYGEPKYVDLWRTLPSDVPEGDRRFCVVTQPILWLGTSSSPAPAGGTALAE